MPAMRHPVHRAQIDVVILGELSGLFYLRCIAAGGFAHAGVHGVAGTSQSARSEGAKAARRAGDDNDVLDDWFSPLWIEWK